MAIGSMRAIHEAGISVPERLSLIGINDISVSKYMYPSLSTIRVHTELMGETAVNTLIERIEGRTDRKSTRLNSSHVAISYAVFCLKIKNVNNPYYLLFDF